MLQAYGLIFQRLRQGVTVYWVIDPDHRTLRVHRFAEPGYQVVLDVGHEAVVRAEPFGELELAVADLFDDEDAPPRS